MKIDLSDAAFYGAWNSEKELKYEVNNWLEKSSFQFFYTGKLIDEFGYKDYAEIEASGHFIPVFKTDIVALKKEYVSRFLSKEAADEILMIMEHNKNKHSNFTGYDVAFNIFCEEHEDIYDDYWNYERCQRLKDAEKWCIENNIPYYYPNDPDKILDLRDTIAWAYGAWIMEDNGFMIPQTVWYYRANCEIMTHSTVVAEYGYEDYDEIMASGAFVPLFKVTQEEIEAEFDSGEDKKLHKERYILEHAKQWCTENIIPYYISKNSPDHLGSVKPIRGRFKPIRNQSGDRANQGTVL